MDINVYTSDSESYSVESKSPINKNGYDSEDECEVKQVKCWTKPYFHPSDIYVASMVTRIIYDNLVNDKIIYYLPITKIGINSKKLKTNKQKVQYMQYKPEICNIPGSIISLYYQKTKRGFIKNNKIPFPNNISVDISIGYKNVNIALKGFSAKISGTKSEFQARKAVIYFLKHCIEADRHLQEIKKLNNFSDIIVIRGQIK